MPHWLLRQRVTIPAAPERYCHRPEIARRCELAGRAVTALMAPGGFGKTTVLAAACRDAVADGLPVAWLTLADDDPATLDTYLAFAFHQAGIDVLPGPLAGEAPRDEPGPRTAVLLHALEARDSPCVLALDELECVANPDSVALLGNLLRHAPISLHLALAYRRLPRGLDAAERLLAGSAELVTAADLRFSTRDIARFFGLSLSRRELARVATDSGGWPIALQMHRNVPGERAAVADRVARDAVGGWIDGRFWRGFAARDRELVLDLALFDWLDGDLVEEVLQKPDALERAAHLPGLAGLLRPSPGARADVVHHLHPLLREHCAEERRRADAGRWRQLRRRLARALARRGAVVEAMRQATEAGGPDLAGSILIDAGGVQWWLAESHDRLAAANRHLTDAAVAAHPRLAMARCNALLLDDRVPEANRAFTRAPAVPVADDPDYALDRLITRAMLAFTGSRPTDEAKTRALVADAWRVTALPGTRQVARGALVFGLAAYRAIHADFDAGVALARQARDLVAGRSTYLTLSVESLLGQVAMARGRGREAARYYGVARQIARERFLEDPFSAACVDVLKRELDLERNQLRDDIDPEGAVREVYRSGGLYAHYAAGAGVACELALAARGADAALAVLGELAERAHDSGLAFLGELLAALRVSVLVETGRIGEAERVWRGAALPTTDAGCLDLGVHSWRWVEAVACARVRLLGARVDPDAANLERSLARLAADRGLKRTLMRSLALRVRLAHDARDPDAARDAAADYLRHFRATDYARPLLRAGPAATAALERILDADPDGRDAAAAERLIAMRRIGDTAPAPPFDAREMAVLLRLGERQDREIAKALGLSPNGVRYHVRKIFRKLGVSRRRDAVRRARALGVLPAADFFGRRDRRPPLRTPLNAVGAFDRRWRTRHIEIPSPRPTRLTPRIFDRSGYSLTS